MQRHLRIGSVTRDFAAGSWRVKRMRDAKLAKPSYRRAIAKAGAGLPHYKFTGRCLSP